MALSEKILEILVCPKCKGGLQYTADIPSLDCTLCRLRYPIREDIPVMLIDEAEKL
jgi:uncharacterized protein YbaR (Trm112 family)